MMQVTVANIRGYGPWTLTLGHDREHHLQMLQASLYKKVQQLFSARGALVFPNRYDEYIIASSGMGAADHSDILNIISEEFQVGLDMYTGRGDTPQKAEQTAHIHHSINIAERHTDDAVTVMHIDVDNLTSRTQLVSPYGISQTILRLHLMMSEYFLERESLSFFMGGDNFMVLASDQGRKDSQGFLDSIQQKMEINLNCGVGVASTGREAVRLATKSLDTIREIRESGSEQIPRIYETDC
ncbi:MAG: GTP cyclohydrolase IIa [Cenarchaeum sp. SB0665_bin_23]|nr:GTP cyclohydrolase IIa [Cenarchaeum sp. SB0667_bin_13]MXY60604.1 GTP cyclohydrolase IIa [Cenarchaeum sp. SB0665_bin_23]MXZ93836.1 GTP cyclohydrolase IIa [Cenarchaeum sp. SB0666_bin_15]MYB46774.1 GTP cyclohydrolase IIa [Cenarchaeum sp. SB0662_bin_33]MYC79939.1 GTP cyclohydrolase IIa [Cenarchaeum sp. SB0661_bin_35]MYD58489.1 GTP cyclohydrolase IIa [Cenarchaeum sp. SB0678_bin_8]MYG33242.1 GTP cyclohydrolase IIa [Cenarchaeum sp. SB0677_bin_16]MYI52016.1 GTP cyclohydrolase IIa [Cenarchaeum sp.